MTGQSQHVLDLGDNSVFIDADTEELMSESLWLRIGQLATSDTRLVRLSPKQARTLGFALMIHADLLEERLNAAKPVSGQDAPTLRL
jgi:hypothetical protein